MKNTIYLTGLLFFIFGAIGYGTSCVKDKNFSNIPEIEFKSLSKSTLLQGNLNQDTIYLTIGFKDGDGDIGNNEEVKLTIIDTRLETSQPVQFLVPELPELGAEQGLEGTMRIPIYSTCCFQGAVNCIPFEDMPTQEVIFSVQLTDNAGNNSNIILTEPIDLLCN